MTDEQRRKVRNRVTYLSVASLAVLLAVLIVLGVTDRVETILFPIAISVCLVIFWVVSDVLAVIWLNAFEGKNDAQKRAYYIYAGLDFIGLGGLVYFMVDLKGTTGILIYICCIFLKKRFREEFSGTDSSGQEETEEAAADVQAEIEGQPEVEKQPEVEEQSGVEKQPEVEEQPEIEDQTEVEK